MPPTPPNVKSSLNTNSTGTPRKTGESRHTVFSREPVSIPIERVSGTTNAPSTDSDLVELYDKAAKSVQQTKEVVSSTRDRRHRSRTLEANQIQAVDNQIYGCPSSSKAKQPTQQRSESHKHRSQRLSVRRSSDDHQDKQIQLRRANEYHSGSTEHMLNETWFDVGQEHWSNLLENGWRPTAETPGVTCVAIADSGKQNFTGDRTRF